MTALCYSLLAEILFYIAFLIIFLICIKLFLLNTKSISLYMSHVMYYTNKHLLQWISIQSDWILRNFLNILTIFTVVKTEIKIKHNKQISQYFEIYIHSYIIKCFDFLLFLNILHEQFLILTRDSEYS